MNNFAASKVAVVVTLFLLAKPALAEERYTFKKFNEVLFSKLEIDDKHVRVWSVRKTPAIKINMVEFTGELPLHKHPDADHSLLVLEGQVRVQVADEKFAVNKGNFISVPANVPHKYWTLSKKAILVSMDAPYYDPKKTIRLE